MDGADEGGRRDQVNALFRVARFRPFLTMAIVLGGVGAALLEGIGLSFIIPIIEIVQSPGDPAQEAKGVMMVFVAIYQSLNIPFSLGFVVTGVSVVLVVRWSLTFLVRWLREALVVDYTRELQKTSFENALDARIEYFDEEGSDDILNAIVTQSEYAGRVIRYVTSFLETLFLAIVYLGIAAVLAPFLTMFAIAVLSGFSVIFRRILEPGYNLGDRVAEANEHLQRAVQAGTQGIRDTKLFGLKNELFEDFLISVNEYVNSSIRLRRNEQALQNIYNMLTAVSVFVLIYLAITFAEMSLGALGIFLFAMFRLGPKASALNSTLYRIENNLPHLVRTGQFIDELKGNREPESGSKSVPEKIQMIEFDDVWFSYKRQDEEAISGLTLVLERNEFIGFVGPSGSGKSTLISLLTRMYEPDAGEIRANGRPIHEMDIDEWRSQIAVVRQNPFIFNDTLRYNLTIGNRDATREELDRVSRIAELDEFFSELPDGYDTQLGDNGIRLSGGQRQRVALARALLKDSEILVLDEATSDLDSRLETKVQQSIETMDREYSIIGIAHRLSTVRNADRIFTMDGGKIVESGNHQELIDRGGTYAKLYSLQSQE